MATKLAPIPLPPALNKHQQKTELTRLKLLKSARRIFARDGFEASRIEDIAADAGYTRGAFYAQFDAKEDLFFALLEQQSKEHIEKLRKVLELCPKHEERLSAVRDYYAKRANDRQWVMLLLEFKLFALRHGKLRAKWAAIHARIRESLKVELSGLHDAIVVPHLSSDLRYGTHSREVTKVGLEAFLSGIVLEHAYDPKRISERDMDALLRHVFDILRMRR